MNDETERSIEPSVAAGEPTTDANPAKPDATERPVSTTVGTGSYIAISCSVMALLVTLVILGILFLTRWF